MNRIITCLHLTVKHIRLVILSGKCKFLNLLAMDQVSKFLSSWSTIKSPSFSQASHQRRQHVSGGKHWNISCFCAHQYFIFYNENFKPCTITCVGKQGAFQNSDPNYKTIFWSPVNTSQCWKRQMHNLCYFICFFSTVISYVSVQFRLLHNERTKAIPD